MHVNKINNKIYIGITCQDVEKRWKKGFGYQQCPHFWNAICKYGWDNFEHIIFADNLTKDDATKMEIMLIALYNTRNSMYGYNVSRGGDGNCDFKHTEESKKKMSESHMGMVVPQDVREKISKTLSGKIVSDETRKKLSAATTLQMTEDAKEYLRNINLGRKHTEETRKKMSIAKSKEVIQFDLSDNIIAEFVGVATASKQTGIDKSCIANCCCGRKNHATAGGFKWRYKDDWIKLCQEECMKE